MTSDLDSQPTAILLKWRADREESIRVMERDPKLRYDYVTLRRLQKELLALNQELARRKDQP